MPSRYKLVYFNGKGRAETIRLIFAATKTKYEDYRIEQKEWADLKQKTTWRTLPLLELDGRPVGQSNTICRFLAKELGLAGRNNLETAMIDSVCEVVTEMREKFIPIATERDEDAKKKGLQEFAKTTLPTTFLDKLENALKKSKSGDKFFMGDKLTWADLHVYACMEQVMTLLGPGILQDYPKLDAHIKRVKDIEEVDQWLTSRPDTAF